MSALVGLFAGLGVRRAIERGAAGAPERSRIDRTREELAAHHGIDLGELAEEMRAILVVMTPEEAEAAIEAGAEVGMVEVAVG